MLNRYFKYYFNTYTITILTIIVLFFVAFIDRPAIIYLKSTHNILINDIFQIITKLGLGQFHIVPALFFAVFCKYYWHIWYERAKFLLICTIIPGICSWIFKLIIGRPRPNKFLSEDLYQPAWFQLNSIFWSFPSGHATLVSASMMALALLIPKLRILFIIFAILVALSRVIVGSHFISDVIAGLYLGSSLTILIAYYGKFSLTEKKLTIT